MPGYSPGCCSRHLHTSQSLRQSPSDCPSFHCEGALQMEFTNDLPPAAELLTTRKAVYVATGRYLSPSTIWRWINKGIEDANGQKIRLQVWYIGRKPSTTVTAVAQFITKTSAARIQKQQRRTSLSSRVTPAQLQSAGLLPKRHARKSREGTSLPQNPNC